MNTSLKYLSLSAALLSLCTNANIQCMLINKLTKTPITVSSLALRAHNTTMNRKPHW